MASIPPPKRKKDFTPSERAPTTVAAPTPRVAEALYHLRKSALDLQPRDAFGAKTQTLPGESP